MSVFFFSYFVCNLEIIASMVETKITDILRERNWVTFSLALVSFCFVCNLMFWGLNYWASWNLLAFFFKLKRFSRSTFFVTVSEISRNESSVRVTLLRSEISRLNLGKINWLKNFLWLWFCSNKLLFSSNPLTSMLARSVGGLDTEGNPLTVWSLQVLALSPQG